MALLKDYFRDLEKHAAEAAYNAGYELWWFQWKPFGKDSMNVDMFKEHARRLMDITGDISAFQRVRVYNCLPPKFKEKVGRLATEEQMWMLIRETVEAAWVTVYLEYCYP